MPFDLLSSLDEEADSGISISDCVKNSRSFDVATVDVVHSQNAIVDSESNTELLEMWNSQFAVVENVIKVIYR